jgi:hypothetical protein
MKVSYTPIPFTRQGGEEIYQILILDVCSRLGVSGQRHSPATLYPGKGYRLPIGYEAGWASELVWTQRIEKKILCLCR